MSAKTVAVNTKSSGINYSGSAEARLAERLRAKSSVCRQFAKGEGVSAVDYPEKQSSDPDLIDWLPPSTGITSDLGEALDVLADCFETTAKGIEMLERVSSRPRRRKTLELLAEAQNMLQSALRNSQRCLKVSYKQYHDPDLSRAYRKAVKEANAWGWRIPVLKFVFLDPTRIGNVADGLADLERSP
jgi:hypothetical protein